MQRNSGTRCAIPISGRHSRKEEGKTMTERKTAMQDPVCGMDVETNTAAGSTEHKGQTYHFCSLTCKEKFDHNPDQYLGKARTVVDHLKK
jgi:YHS domain-containing protein